MISKCRITANVSIHGPCSCNLARSYLYMISKCRSKRNQSLALLDDLDKLDKIDISWKYNLESTNVTAEDTNPFNHSNNNDTNSLTALNLAKSSLTLACQRYSKATPNLDAIFTQTCIGLGCASYSNGGKTHIATATKSATYIWQLDNQSDNQSGKNSEIIDTDIEIDVEVSNAIIYTLSRATTTTTLLIIQWILLLLLPLQMILFLIEQHDENK